MAEGKRKAPGPKRGSLDKNLEGLAHETAMTLDQWQASSERGTHDDVEWRAPRHTHA